MSISGISQLLLTRFWWKFTGRFLGTSRTDSNCRSDICPGNICPWQHLSISGISQLLLTKFWWNFTGRFLGTSRTGSNYHSDICPGNICLSDICPYQEYLSCCWSEFDETLKVGSWEHLGMIWTGTVIFVQATFDLATFVYIRNISAVTDTIWTKL